MNHPLKTIELWTRATEEFVLEVMTRKRRGFIASCALGLLWCLSKLFAVALRVRQAWLR